MPICSKCKEHRTIDEMTKNSRSVRGHGSHCRHCVKANRKATWDYDEKRWKRILRDYGITKAQYEALVEAQHGLCAVCGEPPQERPQGRTRKMVTVFHIDHDHVRNRVRALLCLHCNTGIGYMRERPELARKMIAYLEKYADSGVAYRASRDPVTRKVRYPRAV